MSQQDMAQFRGELFGLRILVIHCLSSMAANVDDPLAMLQRLGETVLESLEREPCDGVPPRHIAAFRGTAATVIAQCIEVAQVVTAETEQNPGGSGHAWTDAKLKSHGKD